ncbi:carotenoid isomerooxygenase-like [Homarus americanus]|uniref:Carotenoid isomerooxygenase-like 3 n=1 Tax=Homarus americanus TaxID=6706 RepID=A0A8J5MP08_HOMAM|nr:carotenoid isomerooxygenase-like [Homarus americanus]KAG7158541.1 Carotenoid isomerooxygenase-like 3 [Homarus americanus]
MYTGPKRDHMETISDSMNNGTATAFPILESLVTERRHNSRTGSSGLYSSRDQQHSAKRENKSVFEKVNDTTNVFFEPLKNENKSGIRNSLDLTTSFERQNSPLISSVQNPRQSTVSGTLGADTTNNSNEKIQPQNSSITCDASNTKTTVKLRNKRRAAGSTTAAWPFSQLDLMKRRSAEISQLRHALEEKIRSQNSTYSRFSTNMNGHDYRRPNSEYLTSSKRPSSVYGFRHRDNNLEKENKEPLISLRNNIYTSTQVRQQQHNRNSAPPGSIDPRKLKYLMDDQRKSSPFLDHKTPGPLLCHNCSSPVNFSPYKYSRSMSYCDEGEDTGSQYYTPMTSPGPRVTHPLKKIRHSGDSDEDTSEGSYEDTNDRVNYYPNCDATIWIRSCTNQITQPLSGVQSGVIPRWLRGALIRNGPGRIQVGEQQYNHIFDGSALLHRFHFREGRVTYQNKFLQSRSYLRDTKAQRIVVNYFGTRAHPDPCKTILQNIASKFTFEEHFTDNAQISLYPYGDGLYALTETPFIFRVDPETLDTHEKVDLTKHIAVLTHTAHPHVDRDGTVYNIGQGVGPFGPKYHICKFPKQKTNSQGKVKSPFEQAEVVGSVTARWLFNPCYMHSFAMTDNYWVIIEQPLVVSVSKIIKVILKQDALIDALQWWEKETKIHVVRRDTGTVTSTQYVTETFFFLHTINAYEDRGHIVLDIAAYKNAEMLHCMFVEALKNAAYDPSYAQMFRGRPKRWVIPLRPNKNAGPHANLITLPNTRCRGRWVKKNVIHLTPELIVNIGCEVPRIHYDEYNGRHYQYFYAICSDVDHPCPGTLVKVDVVNKTHVEWSEDNVYPSEPIFVPSPQAKREDDGVVLSALLRAKGLDQQVCMLVLDATTFTELGRVEFVAPGPVPKCLHGWWVKDGTLTIHPQHNKNKSQTRT